jgi:hypothetical protein
MSFSFLLGVNCFLIYHSQGIINNNHVSSYSISYNELGLKNIAMCDQNRIGSKRPVWALQTITDLQQHHLWQTALCSWEMEQRRWCSVLFSVKRVIIMLTIDGVLLHFWRLSHFVFINFPVSVISTWPLCEVVRQERYRRHLAHEFKVLHIPNFWKHYFAEREIIAAPNVYSDLNFVATTDEPFQRGILRLVCR